MSLAKCRREKKASIKKLQGLMLGNGNEAYSQTSTRANQIQAQLIKEA